MRLHRLELTAFGPFAETTVVDFDALAADGLFLLHGPTGAGKTTILDAIAFALYGTVPGSRRDAKRMHSDHASSQTPPNVVLEATIGGRRVRLNRTPEFSRPKRKGSGVTVERAKATLTWLDGAGVNLSRIQEIAEEVNRLLGMSADQFFQVVLLPQGDFDRFLSAENEDREKLLERLFDTARFGSAEQWLANQRRTSAAELDGKRHGIDRLISQVCITAEVDAVAEPLEAVEWAQGLATTAALAADQATGEVAALRAAADQHAAALADGRRVAALRIRRDAALAQRTEHDAGADHRATLAAELAAARQAEPVAATLRDVEAAGDAVTVAQVAVRAACDQLAAIGGGAEFAVDGSDVDAAVRGWSADLGALETVAAEARTAAQLDAELVELRAQQTAVTGQVTDLTTRLAALPEQEAVAETRARVAHAAAATIPGLLAERDRTRRAATAARELTDQRAALAAATADCERARATHNDAREQTLDLRERRLKGMAAELAAALRPGEPCTVCGSPEHPEPATPGVDTVREADEDAAVATEQVAAVALDAATQRVADLTRRIDVLVADCGDSEPQLLDAAARVAADQLRDAQQLADQVAELDNALIDLRAAAAELHEHLLAAEARLSAMTERLAAGARRVAELHARVAEQVGADGSVQARERRLSALVDAATALRERRTTIATAREAHRTATVRLESQVTAAGFAALSDAVAAIRDTRRREQLDAELTTADRMRAHVDAVLAEPDMATVDDQPAVDIAALETVAAESNTSLQTAVARHADATRRAHALKDLAGHLFGAVDRIAPLQRAHDELATLAEVVAGRGQNARRMSLRSYVLAARLEEVAVAGSARLARMSSDRYEFVHSDTAGPRGRRGGLGLDIRDDHTGATRPCKTLSGGEKFMASLALALGLADTVAAQAGGVMLDTLFIDEGFGSLDSDALDKVMDILDDLRAGGRVVGVVSHVDEMRQRIPSRLHIHPTRTGSHLTQTLLEEGQKTAS